MGNIAISVTGAQAVVTESTLLTGGRIGLPVTFTFDENWGNLEKIALFRAGGKTVSCPVEAGMTVPWEALEQVGCTLQVGVYGCNGDGTVVIPTVWAQVGIIEQGADPEADPGRAPTLPVWQQIRDVAQSVRDDADAGLFQGAPGVTPVRGVDYWTEDDKTEILQQVEASAVGDMAEALDALHDYAQALMERGER